MSPKANGYTYGVYLRPDPLTCRAVVDLTDLLKRQFGIVSAAAFPPHATLAGAVPSDATTEELIAALDPVMGQATAIPVHNAGISRHNIAVTFNVDMTHRGEKNHAIKALAVAIDEALEPLKGSSSGHRMKPFDADGFRAHLSLASHDLETLPHLRSEVEDFLRASPHSAPSDFIADTITLFRFHSADWSGEWWHDLRWWHLHSWKLPRL
ncbi:2'-5' RNA ligase family protein [Plantibacter sp. 2H11-2]|uniref:2'-5' RNA ligase family protein n=1 Tax=Plantibacter sp. 2H11-2 TaxID=3414431 RepID=UPI003CF91334